MTASTELLREQVVKEMQSLRMQLAKSQMALVSLVSSNPQPFTVARLQFLQDCNTHI